MIQTSYYASPSIKHLYKTNPERLVNIAIYKPSQINIASYPKLFPTQSILFEYKDAMTDLNLRRLKENCPDEYNHLKENIEKRYIERYHKEVLYKLNPMKVAKDLDGKILLCYEKPESFCHRHIFAEWMKIYDLEVEELGIVNNFKEEKKFDQILLFA